MAEEETKEDATAAVIPPPISMTAEVMDPFKNLSGVSVREMSGLWKSYPSDSRKAFWGRISEFDEKTAELNTEVLKPFIHALGQLAFDQRIAEDSFAGKPHADADSLLELDDDLWDDAALALEAVICGRLKKESGTWIMKFKNFDSNFEAIFEAFEAAILADIAADALSPRPKYVPS